MPPPQKDRELIVRLAVAYLLTVVQEEDFERKIEQQSIDTKVPMRDIMITESVQFGKVVLAEIDA